MKTKAIILSLICLLSLLKTYSQINMNSSGNIGLGGDPNGSYGLTVSNSANNANSLFYSTSILFYGAYNMNLIIDNTADYGKSVHPVTNNQCNVGNSNKAFEYMWSYTYNKPSDIRQKENIKEIQNSLDIILKLQGVRYDIKKEYAYNDSLIKNDKIKVKSETARKNQIGFIAQDVNKILPEAVTYDDSTDIYGIDYSKVVPVLVEAIKQQQIMIIELKKKLENGNNLKSAYKNSDENITGTSDEAVLYQNTPNPFNKNTTIAYYLPGTIKNAVIYIYNMQGNQIKTVNITENGNGNITINSNELNPGMYLYSLIADGKEIDTKRMILTE